MRRRQLLGALGAGAVGVGLGAGVATTGLRGLDEADASSNASKSAVPFFGAHQAGIATPVQANLHFAAFDVITTSRSRLVDLLKRWTSAAAAMCAGAPVGDADRIALAPPDDSGEALDLPASRLTIT
jgi:deferrochelatase/peroxidase EfeB